VRRLNSSVKVDFVLEKGVDNVDRTYFAYIPLENMVCYAIAESYDSDNDINSAKLAVESVLVAFERNPSFRNIKQYIQYAHDQIVSNSVKNRLEAAIMVVVSDYTRIRYASCGNVKLYLLSDNSFYLKGETQTYFQFSAQEYGVDKAQISENKNLLQYLGKGSRPRPYVSKKIDMPEESTLLLATCNFWERVDDVEILDVYEEAKPEEFVGKVEELLLLTQLKNPSVRSYALASLFFEKTFKEDTAKKKKRRRRIITASIALLVLAIIATIFISAMRATDRRAMAEIKRFDNEGINYSNYGNYSKAHEQYEKARELIGKLRSNWQYTKEKKALNDVVAERWHLFNSIMNGDKNLESGNYRDAREAYQGAQNAFLDVYKNTEIYSGLMVSEILADKLEQAERYIAAGDLIKMGEMYELEESYKEALAHYREANDIIKNTKDLALRKELMNRIFEADRKMNSATEGNSVRQIRTLMNRAENNLNFELALQYSKDIINIYKELGITDNQSLEDKARIERKIKLLLDYPHFFK